VNYIFQYLALKNQQLQQDLITQRLEFETQVVTDLYLPSQSQSLHKLSSNPLHSASTTATGGLKLAFPSLSLELFFIRRFNFPQELSLACEEGIIALLIILVNVAIGILCHRYFFDELPLIDSIYLSVITITTLGYGDIVPRTTSSRGFTILYSIIGVLSTAKAITLINEAASRVMFFFHTPTASETSPGPLGGWGGNGQVDDSGHDGEGFPTRDQELFFDRNEFVLQKLTKMGIITPELRAQVEELFTAMDVTKSGLLSNHDLSKFSDLIHRESLSHIPSSSEYLNRPSGGNFTLPRQTLSSPHSVRNDPTGA
jgi:hypothetical protein